MLRRCLGVVGTLTVLIAVGLLAPITVAGQQTSPAAKTNGPAKGYTPPRTPDGQPDLQGFWTNSTYTPLQRPNNVTKEFYTPEEVGRHRKACGCSANSSRRYPGTDADVHYDEAQFGLNRSQSTIARNLRTSLIVDPPNGKIPPLTAEGEKRLAAREEARSATGHQAGGHGSSERPLGCRAEQLARRSLHHHGACRTADAECGLQLNVSNRSGAWIRDDSG